MPRRATVRRSKVVVEDEEEEEEEEEEQEENQRVRASRGRNWTNRWPRLLRQPPANN